MRSHFRTNVYFIKISFALCSLVYSIQPNFEFQASNPGPRVVPAPGRTGKKVPTTPLPKTHPTLTENLKTPKKAESRSPRPYKKNVTQVFGIFRIEKRLRHTRSPGQTTKNVSASPAGPEKINPFGFRIYYLNFMFRIKNERIYSNINLYIHFMYRSKSESTCCKLSIFLRIFMILRDRLKFILPPGFSEFFRVEKSLRPPPIAGFRTFRL